MHATGQRFGENSEFRIAPNSYPWSENVNIPLAVNIDTVSDKDRHAVAAKVGHKIAADAEPGGGIHKQRRVQTVQVFRFGIGLIEIDVIESKRGFEKIGLRRDWRGNHCLLGADWADAEA